MSMLAKETVDGLRLIAQGFHFSDADRSRVFAQAFLEIGEALAIIVDEVNDAARER